MPPKVIHQIWFGPNRPVRLMDTWKAKHPDWEYKLWTVPPTGYPLSFSGLSDVLRYQILYEYGGVYIDADSECLKPIDDLLDCEAFCSWENEYVTTGLMLGAFMGSVPHNRFFFELLESIKGLQTLDPEWFTVGPGLLTRMVGQLRYQNMVIYPSHYFSPKHHTGLEYKGKGKVYANHFWGSTPKLSSTITKEGFKYELWG